MSRKSVTFDRVTVTQQSSSSSDEKDGSASEEEMDPEHGATGSGWSDAMNRLLSSSVRSKNFILSKAKKDRDVSIPAKNEEKDAFEVISEGGQTEVVTVGAVSGSAEPEKRDRKDDVVRKLRQKARETNPLHEAELNAIATRGVVQLFNAVNQQRLSVSKRLKEAGPSETQMDRVLASVSKADFLKSLEQDRDTACAADPAAKKKRHQKDNKYQKIRFKDVFSENFASDG